MSPCYGFIKKKNVLHVYGGFICLISRCSTVSWAQCCLRSHSFSLLPNKQILETAWTRSVCSAESADLAFSKRGDLFAPSVSRTVRSSSRLWIIFTQSGDIALDLHKKWHWESNVAAGNDCERVFNDYLWDEILFSSLLHLTSVCHPLIRPTCQKNMSPFYTIDLNLMVVSPAILTIQAFTPCKQTVTHTCWRTWPLPSFTHTLAIFFFHTHTQMCSSSCMQMNTPVWTRVRLHTHTHKARQSLIPLYCSVKHNLMFHVSQARQTYLFMIP